MAVAHTVAGLRTYRGWEQALYLLKAVASQRHVVGLDLMELCPREGPTSCAFLAAKLAYKLIGYALLL